MPGPGSYSYDAKQGGGGVFGKETRGKGAKKDGPGPGSYSALGFMGRNGSGQGKSFGVRYKDRAADDGPGPGAYSATGGLNKAGAPSYSMGGRYKNKGKDAGPGPGNYNPDANRIKNKAPGYGMGTGGRSGMKHSDAPGPGNYYMPPKKGGGISFGARHKARPATDGPGPGAYNPDANKIKQSAPGVGFGTPSKGGKGVNDGPGPGNYDSPGQFNPGNK